ncbi:MAG: hypothetical protein WCI36_04495 [bacterium]
MKQNKTKKVQKNNPKVESKKSRWTFFWLFLAIISTSIYYAWNFFQTPVSGKIIVKTVADSQVENKVTFERFEGEYVSFHYNEKYSLKSHTSNKPEVGTILENAFFAQGDSTPKKIALTVESIEGRKMTDVGNYILRDKNSELYLKQNKVQDFPGAVSFASTKDGVFEEVFFIPRGQYLTELAFTGPIDENGDFEAEISDIIKSLQFKK